MKKNEIEKEIDRIETAIFMETMADFMNWGNYNMLKKQLAELKAMLAN